MEHGRIVVVDDEPITRLDVKEMLRSEGYQVVAEGGNGEEAVRLAYRFKPDLIVMDVKMPVMDGLKSARILQRSSSSAVLLLTAFSDHDLVHQAAEAGVISYLVKPVTDESLLPAVKIALHQKRLSQSLQEELLETRRKLTERKLVERAKGRIMEQQRCSEKAAYDTLRKQSMALGITLGELAGRLLANQGMSPTGDSTGAGNIRFEA